MAISVHQVLQTGLIQHETRGYVYDGGHLLGADRVDAVAALLATTYRASFLPPADELARGVFAALERASDGDDHRHIEILQEIEGRIDRHMAGAAARERYTLSLERSAVRSFRAEYEQKVSRKAAHDHAWGAPLPAYDRAHSPVNGNGNGHTDGPIPGRRTPREDRS
jgi:hypothetical protein